MLELMLRRIVEFHIPAEVDMQPVVVRICTIVRTEAIHLLVDTVELAVDTVTVIGIVEVQWVDRMSVQKQEQGMEWMLHHWWDMELMRKQEQVLE